jgi:hypothetical protein
LGHEWTKSWTEPGQLGKILGGPHAILLPELFRWQILTGIEDFKWKSLILAGARGAIG